MSLRLFLLFWLIPYTFLCLFARVKTVISVLIDIDVITFSHLILYVHFLIIYSSTFTEYVHSLIIYLSSFAEYYFNFSDIIFQYFINNVLVENQTY